MGKNINLWRISCVPNARVAVFTHINPDADCICSGLAIKHALELFDGISVDVFGKPDHEFFCWIQNVQDVKEEIEKDKEYDFAIIVDTAIPERIYGGEEALNLIGKTRNVLIIDHHSVERTRKSFGDRYPDKKIEFFLDISSESVCEILAIEFGKTENLKPPTCAVTNLFNGIYIETEGLRSSSSSTLEALFILRGFEPSLSFENVSKYATIASINTLTLFGEMLSAKNEKGFLYRRESKHLLSLWVSWERLVHYCYGGDYRHAREIWRSEDMKPRKAIFFLRLALGLRSRHTKKPFYGAFLVFPSYYQPGNIKCLNVAFQWNGYPPEWIYKWFDARGWSYFKGRRRFTKCKVDFEEINKCFFELEEKITAKNRKNNNKIS